MLLRLALLVIVGAVLWRWATGRWPGRGHARSRAATPEIAAACNLLGVVPGASSADIIAAHRRQIAAAHPDRGGSAEAVHALDAARDLLLGDIRAAQGDRLP